MRCVHAMSRSSGALLFGSDYNVKGLTDIWKTHVQTLCKMDMRKVICILNLVRVVILILHFSSEMPFLKSVLEETVQRINGNFYKAGTYSRATRLNF